MNLVLKLCRIAIGRSQIPAEERPFFLQLIVLIQLPN